MKNENYGRASRWLHWLTLLLLCLDFATAWSVDLLPRAQEWLMVDPHRTIGMALWFMVLLRLGWRWIAGVPAPEPAMPRWQAWSAKLTHVALYVLLLAVPVLGYLYADARALPDLFGAVPLPSVVGASRQLARTLRELHALGANLLLWLIGLHAAAALYHHYWVGDGVLRRMIPQLGSRAA